MGEGVSACPRRSSSPRNAAPPPPPAPCPPCCRLQAAAELHIVHTSEDGKLLVIGILLRLAAMDNPVFAKFWWVCCVA
jgi:hypothetical protein